MKPTWIDVRASGAKQAIPGEAPHQRVNGIVSDFDDLPARDRHAGYPINEFCLEQ